LRDGEGTAGIAITASHNPSEDNGLKVLGPGGGKLSPDVEAAIDEGMDAAMDSAPIEGQLQSGRGDQVYLAAQLAALGDVSHFEGLKIALDAAHGAAFETGPRLLRSLGIEPVLLGVSPDGQNINKEIGALHPEALQAAVREKDCAAGIGLDGDADRCVLVDGQGSVIHGDALLLLLARSPGVVGTVMCNGALERALGDRGIGFARAAVGDRNVQIEMQARGWQVGGEPSGHVLLADALPTGDGLVSGLRALAGGVNLKERLADWSPLPAAQAGIQVQHKPPLVELKLLQALLKEAEEGLDGRVLLRYSGTESKLRVLVEARSQDLAQSWVDRFEQAVKAEGL